MRAAPARTAQEQAPQPVPDPAGRPRCRGRRADRALGRGQGTFYRHFRTKDDLALAYLERWYEERSAAIEAAVARHRDDGRPILLAVFDVFDEWFRQGSVEVSSFLHVLMEMGPAQAGLGDPEGFAWSCHILLKGSIVAAAEGDAQAAGRARRMAALLIAGSRPEAEHPSENAPGRRPPA